MPTTVDHPSGQELQIPPPISVDNGTDQIHQAWYRIFNWEDNTNEPANPWIDDTVSGLTTREGPMMLGESLQGGHWLATGGTNLNEQREYKFVVWIVSASNPTVLVPTPSKFWLGMLPPGSGFSSTGMPPESTRGSSVKKAPSASPVAKKPSAKLTTSKKTAPKKAATRKAATRKAPPKKGPPKK